MIKRVNLEQTGLGMFLGPTEVHVMRALWHGPKTLQEIHTWIIKHRNPTQGYSAVNTVLARLIEKEYVSKRVEDNQHAVYRPMTISEKDFIFKCLIYVCTHISFCYARAFAQAYDIAVQESQKRIDSIITTILENDV